MDELLAEVEILKRFRARADRLLAQPLARTGWTDTFALRFEQGRIVGVSVEGPDERDLQVLLLQLRPFVSAGEDIFIGRIFGIMDRRLTDNTMRQYLRNARARWKSAQRSLGITLVVDGEILTPEALADLWINGYYFHDDAEKAKKLRATGALGLSRFQFCGYVSEALMQVANLHYKVTEALSAGLLS